MAAGTGRGQPVLPAAGSRRPVHRPARRAAVPGVPDRRVPDADRRAALSTRPAQPRHRRRRRPHLRPPARAARVRGQRHTGGPEIVDSRPMIVDWGARRTRLSGRAPMPSDPDCRSSPTTIHPTTTAADRARPDRARLDGQRPPAASVPLPAARHRQPVGLDPALARGLPGVLVRRAAQGGRRDPVRRRRPTPASSATSARASSPSRCRSSSARRRGSTCGSRARPTGSRTACSRSKGWSRRTGSPSTFTMNWKITRVCEWVRFEKDEPFCMLVPVPRGLAESLVPRRETASRQPGAPGAIPGMGGEPQRFPDGPRRSRPGRRQAGLAEGLLPGEDAGRQADRDAPDPAQPPRVREAGGVGHPFTARACNLSTVAQLRVVTSFEGLRLRAAKILLSMTPSGSQK